MQNNILLVEFVIINRFHCGISVPYINGLLKKSGYKTTYLRCGLESKDALDKENRVKIDEESTNAILSYLMDKDYSDIVFSHRPSDSFISIIQKHIKNIYFIEMFDNSKPNIAEFYKKYNIYEMDLFEEIPDFNFININRLAREFRPLPHLILYNECNYKRSIINNSLYEDIDLPDYSKKTGCSFCVRPDLFKKEQFDRNKIVSHIKSAINTTPWNGFRPRLRIIGEIIAFNIDEFFKLILANKIDNIDFLFNFRVDNFLKSRDKIETGLKLISKTKNRFALALVGIENFSNKELLLYNKGFKNCDIFNFLKFVFELKNKYKEHFEYEEYGGFSLILFNPFTTLEDLRLNYHLIKYLNIENLCGKLFTSRIRLYKELPIYHLAKRDNLIIKRYKDKKLDTASWNFYKDEIPWRYRERIVNQINQFFTKKNNINIDCAIRYLDKLSNKKFCKKDIPESLIIQPLSLETRYLIEAEVMNIWKERKIGKIELSNKEDKKRHLTYIMKYFNHIKVVENKTGIPGLSMNIYYSNNIDINRLNPDMFIEDTIHSDEYYYNIGKLLGYPDCCIGTYVKKKFFLINNYMFIYLLLRYSQNKISIYSNPFIGNMFFIPCNLNCKQAEKIIKIIYQLEHSKYKKTLPLHYPVIFLLPFNTMLSKFEDNLDYVIVKPKSVVDDEFSYEPVSYYGNDRRLNFILASDRLIMKDGFMHLFKGKRHIHTFCAEANVWYYKKPLDYKFWKSFSEAYYTSVIYQNKYNISDIVNDPEYKKLLNILNQKADVLKNMGYKLMETSVERNVVISSLNKENKNIILRIQKIKDSDKYYIKGKKYYISIGKVDDGVDFIDEAVNIIMRIIEDEKR